MIDDFTMKKESIKLMKLLNIYYELVWRFAKKNTVYVSDNGDIFRLPNKHEKDMIKEIESWDGVCKVFHILKSDKMFTNYLYIPDRKNEFEMHEKMAKMNVPFAYVENNVFPECSEFGRIAVKNWYGGLVRSE